MCGRFAVSLPPDEVARYFQIPGPLPNFPPRYNIAPTQDAPAVRFNPDTRARQLDLLRFGLVPGWAKDPLKEKPLINARAETVAKLSAFRDAFAKRRCLVVADGFYEWRKLDAKRKQPYRIALRSGAPMAFAGIWNSRRMPDDSILRSFAILTTTANELAAEIHDRMPTIIHPSNYAVWLGETEAPPDTLAELARLSYPASDMTAYPVSARVNSPRNDDPGCIERLAEA